MFKLTVGHILFNLALWLLFLVLNRHYLSMSDVWNVPRVYKAKNELNDPKFNSII